MTTSLTDHRLYANAGLAPMLLRHHAARLSSTVTLTDRAADQSYRLSSRTRPLRTLNCGLVSRTSAESYSQQCRAYATGAEKKTNIAVLGGGITGLATAYFLTQEFPHAKISLFESKEDLGGWVKSEKVKVPGGEVIFESGPRSLRPAPPAGTLTLKLVCSFSTFTCRGQSWC